MNLEIKAIHFSLKDEEKDYLQKKLDRLRQAEANVIDLLITLSKDGKEYAAEATLNFKWGISAHIKEKDFVVEAAIDRLVDTLAAKITKEKEKTQEKR